ncbi:MAG: glycerophosphodiester phosphodiesterase [bacterium]|nr:glycerophosphodiester phosphodiesterase [bacterium]
MKLLRIVVIVLLLLVGLPVGGSLLMSPPSAGQNIAAELSIPYPAVVAHRGASWDAPEETKPAYLLARSIRAEFLEMDLQRSRDGVLLAFHDDTLERTTNVAEIFPGREKQTIDRFSWFELQRLDAGSWFNKAHPDRARDSFVGEKILRFEDFLEIAEFTTDDYEPGIYIETKAASRFPGIERQMVNILRRRGWMEESRRGRIIFQSFEHESLARLKDLAPEVPRVYLIGSSMADEEGFDELLERASELAEGVGPVGYLAWPWYTGPAHRKGLLIHHYTINAKWQMRLLNFFGSDGFFTDRPDQLMLYYGKDDHIDMRAKFQQIGY